MGHFGLNSYGPFEGITWPSALLFRPPGGLCPARTGGVGDGWSRCGVICASIGVVREGALGPCSEAPDL